MRLEFVDDGWTVRVVLSRRNLESLLAKLDIPGSHRTLWNGQVIVTAEDNEAHYQGRLPGDMDPVTEAQLTPFPKCATVVEHD
jgi:hypothetical protein